MEPRLEEKCATARETVSELATRVKQFMNAHDIDDLLEGGDSGEARANIMLAYRHLEVARMRLGMVMQQCQGAARNFDK